MRLSFALLLVAGSLSGLSGCQGPCRTLAEQICRCSASPREQSACEVRIDSNDTGGLSAQQEEQCDALLETCTCEALQLGQRHLCGLSELPADFEVGSGEDR